MLWHDQVMGKSSHVMRCFSDGNQLCMVQDDFENLQESPVVFIPFDDERGKLILERGPMALPLGDLFHIRRLLELQREGTELTQPEMAEAYPDLL